MADTARLAINLATIREQCGLAEAIPLCARMGIRAVAPWRDQVAATGLRETRRLLRDCGLEVSSLCRGGMFPAAERAERRRRIEDNRRAIEEAATLGAPCLVLVCGGLPPESRDLEGARHMVEDGIAEILDDAAAAGVRLGIEPLHPVYTADRSVIVSLAQALDICDGLGSGTPVGVVLDVYHLWWDPGLSRQIERAGDRILGFHVCDWLVPTRDLLLDRGMMGDGVIDIPRIRGLVEAQGYRGWHEVEIFSERDWWRRPPEEVIRICIERHALHC